MKRVFSVYIVMIVLAMGIFASVKAEHDSMASEGLQKWDIQENEVIQMMRKRLIGQHEYNICRENGERWHPLNDGYDPDDYYSYLCTFSAFVYDDVAYRYWYCYAFYLNMPYSGWYIKVDSPSGKEHSLGPVYAANTILYEKGDDIRATYEVIEDHMDTLSAIHPSLSETAEYSFRLDLEREYLGAWIMNYRIIPIKLYLHTDHGESEFNDLYAVIRVDQRSLGDCYWKISVYSEEAIMDYGELSPTLIIPHFSDHAVFQADVSLL